MLIKHGFLVKNEVLLIDDLKSKTAIFDYKLLYLNDLYKDILVSTGQ